MIPRREKTGLPSPVHPTGVRSLEPVQVPSPLLSRSRSPVEEVVAMTQYPHIESPPFQYRFGIQGTKFIL